MQTSFYDTIAKGFVEYNATHTEQETLDFVFNTKTSLAVLTSRYDNFIKDGIDEIEKLSKEKREKYWDIACKYFETMGDRIKASKSCYVLELITSTF